MQTLDIEISAHDVQGLNGADAVAAFFAKLGYNTDARIPQTAGNLGITADSLTRHVKKIELLANHEGLFQVYLFELTSVTIAHTRALARAFRNRAGNYLLVLTSDYDRLDFVLVEKYVPLGDSDGSGSAFKQTQVGVRPRVLTVERKKPTRVHLRVLRRMTYTEANGIAQYEKLLSAYAVADWSEEFFNNRALFSDYYLRERLPSFPQWKDDPKPSYLKLRELYQEASSRFSGKDEATLRKELLEPALDMLGFEVKHGKQSGSSAPEPDYTLTSHDKMKHPLAHCLVYPWARSLDGKDYQRDNESPDENPGAVVVSLLEKGDVPWVVMTNGKLWRLYAKRTHSRATNYYEIDLEEVLAQSGPHATDPAGAFRYFWLLFRQKAFEPQETERDGKKVLLSLLDRLLLDSEDYAKELGNRLKERAFEDIFPYLAAGFIAHIRARDGIKDVTQEVLNTVFQGTLTLLYRLLFLLYAEARDLLPVKEVRGYFGASLTHLKREIAEAAGTIDDEVPEKLKKHYRSDEYKLYERLLTLFRIVDKGDVTLNVPMYNGGLFLTEPDADEDTPEARNARFLNAAKIPDFYLAQAIDLLSRDVDDKRQDLVFIDYKSLGVRQLGSIYEGLLEFKLRIAGEKLAVVKEKNREVVVPFNTLDEKARSRAEKQKRVIKKGEVYLENDKRERKATGSYYTPDYIVKYIVEHTVGPVLAEKFETMRQKLREAQQKHRAFFQRQDALKKQGLKPEPVSKSEFFGQELVNEFFDIKVLDPAMGSGHFLVEAVDFITDKIIDFLNAFPWNPVLSHLARMRETILHEMDTQGITIDPKRLTDVNLLKRHVLKRCIYGVDLNPMAVELAKVSLWLDCFTLGAPLSFLDHHLRCGNSLIGVTEKEVEEAQKGQMNLLGTSLFTGAKIAVGAMIQVGALPDLTSAQTRESRKQYSLAVKTLEPAKRVFNVYTSQWFSNKAAAGGKGKKKGTEHNPVQEFLRDGISTTWAGNTEKTKLPQEYASVVQKSLYDTREKKFFHWELEFPEVFYAAKPGTTQVIERSEGAGFDAVIGNPPYDVIVEDEFAKLSPAKGTSNLFGHFIARGTEIVRIKGGFGFVVPLSFSCGSDFENVRQRVYAKFGHLVASHFSIRPAKLFPNVEQRITIFVAHGKPNGGCNVASSKLYRFHDGEQENLVLHPEIGVAGILTEGYIPRVGSAVGASVYRKFNSISTRIGDFVVNGNKGSAKWWFHSVGRYWLKAYNFLPLFSREENKGVSTTMVEVLSKSANVSKACISVINSNLFYFWWITQCDEFHVLRPEVFSMPIPESVLKDKILEQAVNRLMEDYKEKAIKKKIKAGGKEVFMEEIHARLSRPLILEIDKILAPHYGLTPEELQFLQEYDIQFRVTE